MRIPGPWLRPLHNCLDDSNAFGNLEVGWGGDRGCGGGSIVVTRVTNPCAFPVPGT